MSDTVAGPEHQARLKAIRAAVADAPISATMGLVPVELEHGCAVFEGEPGEAFRNPIGTVHGGYAATLLDSACGIAVQSQLAAGQRYATLELKASYLRALNERSGRVRAVGRVISSGRRAAFAEATLVDGRGELCATATSTLLVIEAASTTDG